MSAGPFIHLRVHSSYSLSAGAIRLKELPGLCRRHGMPAVAVTDTGNLFGALEYAGYCTDGGIQPIFGVELAITPSEAPRGQGMRPAAAAAPEPIVLLAQTERGYFNLVKLVSRSYLETEAGGEAQLALSDLAPHTEDLICLTGGPLGPVGRLLLENRADLAEAVLLDLARLFSGRLYVELHRHGMAAEDRTEAAFVDLAYRHDLPLVATNDVFFAGPEQFEAHDALRCIAQGTTLNAPDRERLTQDHGFRSAAEMAAVFSDLPEACTNTLVIAERCSFVLRKRKPILPPFTDGAGESEAETLRRMAEAGLDVRLDREVYRRIATENRADTARRYREQLDYELGVIERMGYPGYFLIVADFIQWAKARGIPVGPGRGSGAGSVVAWALTITDVDPLRYGLFFERFLNPERVSMPDFDVDFCQERRQEVIDYVQERYGAARVAQIITFQKLQARAVLRDVGRVMEMPFPKVDRIAKLVPNNPAKPVTLAQALEQEDQLRAQRDGDPEIARLIELALQLEGLNRNASTHAAGVVIGDRPLDELVALYREPGAAMPATQFSMKHVEDAGLVKFDFLGLKTLTVIDRTLRLLAARGIEIDLLTLPIDDKPTFEMLARGETVGVFQFEGAGMRKLLRDMKPTRFEDLIASVSLFRPGPMDSIPEYIQVKHGKQPPDYMHPTLQPVLEETYGVMTYQEQVMKIAQVLGGYTLGGADLLRRAMGKKNKEEMAKHRQIFFDGAANLGVDRPTALLIFDKMEKFAGYGFNKGHAAPYALIAYQTAYLKANHPIELIAASMTLDMANTDKLNVYREELHRMEVRLLPPDINRSETEFSVEEDGEGRAVRYALAAVKGVGAAAIASIVAERKRGGAYRDLFDFAERLETRAFNRKQVETLAKAGAFDGINRNRAQCFAAAETVMRHAALAAEQRASSQIALFGNGSGGLPKPRLPVTADWAPVERLQQEFEAIGFYLSAHPLDPYRTAMGKLDIVPAARLVAHLARRQPGRVRLAGIVSARRERTSAKGARYAFVTMTDLSGSFEMQVFSELLTARRALLESGRALLVSVDARIEGEDMPRLVAQTIEPLDEAAESVLQGFTIVLGEGAFDPAPLQPLRVLLDAVSGQGKGRIGLAAPIGDRVVEIALPGRYPMSGQFRNNVAALACVAEIRDF